MLEATPKKKTNSKRIYRKSHLANLLRSDFFSSFFILASQVYVEEDCVTLNAFHLALLYLLIKWEWKKERTEKRGRKQQNPLYLSYSKRYEIIFIVYMTACGRIVLSLSLSASYYLPIVIPMMVLTNIFADVYFNKTFAIDSEPVFWFHINWLALMPAVSLFSRNEKIYLFISLLRLWFIEIFNIRAKNYINNIMCAVSSYAKQWLRDWSEGIMLLE